MKITPCTNCEKKEENKKNSEVIKINQLFAHIISLFNIFRNIRVLMQTKYIRAYSEWQLSNKLQALNSIWRQWNLIKFIVIVAKAENK